MEQQANAELAMPGLLENVPGSWLTEWIRSLHPKEKQALFQTCRWLAKHVVEHAGSITLELPGWLTPFTEEDMVRPLSFTQQLLTHAPRGTTVRLLTARTPLKVHGALLGKWVSELFVMEDHDGLAASPDCASVCWGAFVNITSLFIHDAVTEKDMEQLYQATQAGCFQRLQKLYTTSNDPTSMVHAQRLGSALQANTRLSSISTNKIGLLHQAKGYPLLQQVYINNCYLPADIIKELCGHPSQQDVVLDNCSLERCTGWPECRWKSVTLNYCDMKVLASLPLICIPKVVFGNVRATKDERDVEALMDVLTNHSSKLVCRDHPFSLHGVCKHTAHLVKQLLNQPELYILNSVGDPTALKGLWTALPACVTSVVFLSANTGNIEGLDWACLWDSIPITVTHVSIRKCYLVPVDVLAVMVRTAPEHVRRLIIGSGGKAGARDAWIAAGLPDMAPAHLTLIIR